MLRLFLIGYVIVLGIVGGVMAEETGPSYMVDAADQLLLVKTPNWSAIAGTLQRYEREPRGSWREVGSPIPIVVGKKGLGWGVGYEAPRGESTKREGDRKSPAGIFSIGQAFGHAETKDTTSLKIPYTQLTPSIECVDDPNSKFYTQLIDRKKIENPDWKSSEVMASYGELYRWGIFVEYNTKDPVPGRGSCIFIHVWNTPKSPTGGCTAMDKLDIEVLLKWLDLKRRPILVQLTAESYAKHQESWHLP